MRLRTPLPGVPLPVTPQKARGASPQAAPRVSKRPAGLPARATPTARRRCARPRPGLERVSVQESARAFWWTVGAFFEAIVAGGLDPGFGAKQLAARLDLQIRRVVEGSVKVADAAAARGALLRRRERAGRRPRCRPCRGATGSRGSIPSAEALNADMIRLQPILREMREELGTAKNIWLRVTLGRADSLPKLRETLQRVHENAIAIGNNALTELDGVARRSVSTRCRRRARFRKCSRWSTRPGYCSPRAPSRTTAASRAISRSRSRRCCARLDAAREVASDPGRHRSAGRRHLPPRAGARAARAGRPRDPGQPAPHGAGARRVLPRHDEALRDRRRSSKDSHQIRGAFQMLEQDDADQLLRLCEEQIDSYANPDTPVGDEDLELLAESLCGLGFFVEALQQQRADGGGSLRRSWRSASARPRAAGRRRDGDGRGRRRGFARSVAASSLPKSAVRRPMPRRAPH